MNALTAALAAALVVVPLSSGADVDRALDVRAEYRATLLVLGESLLALQEKDPAHVEFGGIRDPESNLFYSRAAEAVYPFTVLYRETGDRKWRDAALHVGDWLLRQQADHGGWVENPWEWTGTTADQLLMLALAWPELRRQLDAPAQARWQAAMIRAADYLVKMMSPEWASFNYVPTTAATLAAVWHHVAPEPRFLEKARWLARESIAQANDDLFFEGEAARVYGAKYGVDLGYQIDMSLWGLTLYARLVEDRATEDFVRRSVREMLWFVYPNGLIDTSWGARAYKWTGYGSKTADGCQVLFSLWADEDPRYQTAALRNLDYLRSAIRDGLVGYGPQLWALPGKKPNIYPTFARAKNLAMALTFGRHQTGPTPPLPTEIGRFIKHFPQTQLAIVRSGEFVATISAYDYRDHLDWGRGKYAHHPRGGALCNLYLAGHGLLTTASQTRYVRGEEIHMPEIKTPIQPLTPRIEYADEHGYFANLYDSDARLLVLEDGDRQRVQVNGELANEKDLPGGVAFRIIYDFTPHEVVKHVTLRYHSRHPEVSLVEPIVLHAGLRVVQVDARTVRVEGGPRIVTFSVANEDAILTVGANADHFWQLFPGLHACPIHVRLPADPQRDVRTVLLRYSVTP
jgi:hypothetical protein